MPRRKSPTHPDILRGVERRIRCLELRKSGWSYHRIAAELGISVSAVCKTLKVALDELRTEVSENAQQLKTLELGRIDGMFERAYGLAVQGNLLAIDRCLKLMDLRAKYLGLYEKTEFDGEIRLRVIYGDRSPTAMLEELREDLLTSAESPEESAA